MAWKPISTFINLETGQPVFAFEAIDWNAAWSMPGIVAVTVRWTEVMEKPSPSLATSDEPAATVSGKYFFHQKLRDADPATNEIERQDLLLDLCRKVSGTPLKIP